jgi:cytochrome c6
MRRGLEHRLLVPAATIAAAALLMTPTAASTTFGASAVKRVTVRATDSGFRLSVRVAPAGAVRFTVINTGKKRHNFRIAGKKTPVLRPGKRSTLLVSFKRAGKYVYVSTVAGDVKKGLRGTFTVKAKAAAGAAANVAAGKKVFATNTCATCHTLKSAGVVGTIGPNLDTAKISRALIVSRVTNGKGTMPAFKGTLTPKQIQDVADFIVQTRTG